MSALDEAILTRLDGHPRVLRGVVADVQDALKVGPHEAWAAVARLAASRAIVVTDTGVLMATRGGDAVG